MSGDVRSFQIRVLVLARLNNQVAVRLQFGENIIPLNSSGGFFVPIFW